MQITAPDVLTTLLLLLGFGSLFIWSAIIRKAMRGETLVEFEPRPAVPWHGWDVLALLFLYIVLEGASLQVAMREGELEIGTLSISTLARLSAAHLIWLAFAVPYLSYRASAYLDDLGLSLGKLPNDLRLGAKTFLAAIVPVYGIQSLLTYVLDFPSEHPLAKLARDQSDIGVLLLATLSAVVIAPLIEEFLFRVVLQGWLEKQEIVWRKSRGIESDLPGLGPIIVVSTIFGLLHMGHGPDPVALFVLSLFLGYAYRQTHRIYASLLVHMCVNGLAMLELWVQFFSGK